MRAIELLKVTGQATAGAAGTVVCELEPGFRYHDLTLCMTAAASALTVNFPTEHRLKINGTTQRSVTPNNLDLLNQINNNPVFNTIAQTAGALAASSPVPFSAYRESATSVYVKHFFSEPWNTPETREFSALDLLPEDTGSIEVPFANVVAAPTVTFVASVEPIADVLASGRKINRVNGRPTLVKINTGSATPGAATLNITNINKTFSNADDVQHIRFADADQAITAAELTVNDVLIYKRTEGQNYSDLFNQNMMPPVTGYFDIVPNASGNKRNGWIWTPADKVNVKLTFAAAAATAVAFHIQRFGMAD